MNRQYSSYKVEKKNIRFFADDGRIYSKTVIITFYDSKGDELSTELLGSFDNEHIYSLIDKGEAINLDNCYVEDFSLSVYRQSKGMAKKDHVKLCGFSAREAFFESHRVTDFSYADFGDGDVTFEEAHFARGKVSFAGIVTGRGNFFMSGSLVKEGNIEFNGARMGEGNFEFKNAILGDGIKDFQDMVFCAGEVNFANTEFNAGEILFINTSFGEGLFSFKIARIVSGRIDFHYAKFGEGDVIFERVEFGDSRVDFRAVDFGPGRVNFNRSVFGNIELLLEGASFTGSKFFFKKVTMGGGIKDFSLMEMHDADLSFERTDFGSGDLSFLKSRCKTLSLRSCHLDHYVDLRIASAGIVDLADSIVRDIIDLEPYDDEETKVKILDISGMRLIGKLYMDWKRNRCKEVIMRQEHTTIRQKAEQFRVLKENFAVTGKYDDEDQAYIMFKRLESKSDLHDHKKIKKGIRVVPAYLSYGFRWLVFDAAGQYATNPIRVLFTMLVSYTFFSLLFIIAMLFFNGNIIPSVDEHLSLVAKAFYHSAVTFLTIGYGDHYPYGSVRWMSGLEGFVGLFLMSYFTVAFVRKILR